MERIGAVALDQLLLRVLLVAIPSCLHFTVLGLPAPEAEVHLPLRLLLWLSGLDRNFVRESSRPPRGSQHSEGAAG